jgi:hypothetical protein
MVEGIAVRFELSNHPHLHDWTPRSLTAPYFEAMRIRELIYAEGTL